MINLNEKVLKIRGLLENNNKHVDNYNNFVSTINEITFITMSDDNIMESNDGEREKVLSLIKNNEFEVNQYEQFMEALFLGKRSEFLTPYNLEQIKEMTTYKVKGYNIGYGIKSDGDIVSVFNNSNVRNIGKALIKSAIANGGTKLDHFDGYLSDLYEPLGFKEYERYKWDDQYAPKDWDYDKYGRPDVVMRSLNK